MASTKNCIICFKKATGYGGHVHKGKQTLIAGICNDHLGNNKPNIKPHENCKGCYGEWKEQMGIDNTFGEMGYIDNTGYHTLK